MQAIYSKPDKTAETVEFLKCPFRENPRRVQLAVDATIVGFEMSIAAVEQYREKMPHFAQLCEERIFELGQWPASVPYPVKR